MPSDLEDAGSDPRRLRAMLQRAAREPVGNSSPADATARINEPPFLFVAYARADQKVVRLLIDELRNAGLEVRWDQDIRIGDDFRDCIGGYLARSFAVVVVWSPASVRSKFTIDEASTAELLGKLVTLRTPDLSPQEVPLGFRQYRCESIFDRDLILQSIAALAADARQPA